MDYEIITETSARTMNATQARDYARSQGKAHARTIPADADIFAIKAEARKDWGDIYKYWLHGFDSELALWSMVRPHANR